MGGLLIAQMIALPMLVATPDDRGRHEVCSAATNRELLLIAARHC
jgi:hypothetical protein